MLIPMSLHVSFLSRLHEHIRRTYEEEKERHVRLNEAVKTYLAFQTLILTLGVFKLIPLDKFSSFIRGEGLPFADSGARILGVTLFTLSLLFFCISFIYTILVLRVWRFERPCDPERMLFKASLMSSESELLSSMITDYAVAANRNYKINEKKAKLVSRALFSLVLALILFVISVLAMNF